MQSNSRQKTKASARRRILTDEKTEFSHRPADRIKSIKDFKACLSRANDFRIKNKRPFVTISYAQSVDGSIASRNRLPIQLSGPESSVLTHQIRASCDAVLIGIGTLLADDPQLTVRLVDGSNPQPIILDTRLRTPLSAKLVKRSDPASWIINEKDNRSDRTRALKNAGASPIYCTTAKDGKIDLFALMAILYEKRINSVMVEGGAKVITSFVNLQLVDQFIITVSPRLVGGLQVIDSGEMKLESNLTLGKVNYQHLGDDLIIWARPVWQAH
jgi:3,4-dihydroxy 2-butanone 4-phosphate synthase/GTP cyclohydrolase II